MTPDSARNIEFVGNTDLNGRGDGVQVMVHKGHAFVGHMFSDGFTIVDVRDPKQPRPVNFIPAPPNSRAFHLQTHGDLLLTVNSPNIWVLQGYSDPNDYFKASITETFTRREKEFTAGLRVFDISKPAEPREIAFMPVDGLGLHRLWYVGGRYAYASCHWQGFTDHVLAIIDMQDPTRPEVVGRWWIPGMHQAGGEIPSWKGRRYALHHALSPATSPMAPAATAGSPCSMSAIRPGPSYSPTATSTRPSGAALIRRYRSPIATCWCSPTRPALPIAAWASAPIWLFDVREPTNPVSFATMSVPSEADYCAKGGNFGPAGDRRVEPAIRFGLPK